MFQGAVSVSRRQLVMWFDSRLRHNAFRKSGLQTFRLPYHHFIVASQWDGKPAFTVHAECYIAHAFRAE